MNVAITDEELEELRRRNAARVEQAKQAMGNRYLLHPDNQVTRKSFQKRIRQNRKNQANV